MGRYKNRRVRLTQTFVNKLEPKESRYSVFDESQGLVLRVEPSGSRLYYADYSVDGKRSSRKLGSSDVLTVAQAREAARDFLARVRLGEDVSRKKAEAGGGTLGEYLEQYYFPWVLANRKSGEGTVAILKRSFGFLLDTRIEDISMAGIERWRVERVKEVKSASINRLITALKSALNWGVKRDIIEANPLSRIERLQERDSQPKVRYLLPDERERLMAALDEREERIRAERDNYNKWLRDREKDAYPDLREAHFADHIKPMILISLNIGIRRGALFGLIWGDVDLDNRILTLRAEEDKTRKVNHVPMNDIAYDTFYKLHSLAPNKSDEALVFPSPKTGDRIDNCRTAWGNLMKAADIKNFRWHDMRHDFASQLVMRGVDLNTVRELLGHADIKMTLRYAHLAPEAKARAVKTLEPPTF